MSAYYTRGRKLFSKPRKVTYLVRLDVGVCYWFKFSGGNGAEEADDQEGI
jgi:hypothetical protein